MCENPYESPPDESKQSLWRSFGDVIAMIVDLIAWIALGSIALLLLGLIVFFLFGH